MELKKRKKDFSGFISLGIVRVMFFFLAFILILLLGKIFIEGIGVISLEFLIDEPRNNMTEGGIGPAIFGTVAVTLFMVLFAVPLGVFSAIYLNEYAKDTFFTRIIRTSINNLAGVPSIVFGLFGLGLFVFFFRWGCSIISGCPAIYPRRKPAKPSLDTVRMTNKLL